MRIAICDDEKIFIDDFINKIDKLYSRLDVIVDVFMSGEELLKLYSKGKYDIIFLDIEMPTMDGLTVAKKLRCISEEVYIVFLTGHVEYALKGYEVSALRYLQKPVNPNDIREIVNYVVEKQHSKKFLWIKNSEGEQRILLSDIIYIEAQDQRIDIVTINGRFLVLGKLNNYEEKFKNEDFFRIHRSYLVALSKIVNISGSAVTVAGGVILPIGRTKEKKFRQAFMDYINREAI